MFTYSRYIGWNMQKKHKRISSRDVAERAGVSQATVSRVFTPGKQVSVDKRHRVMKAADELNYKPSIIARSLIQNSTRIIGIVMKRFESSYYTCALDLFSQKLQTLGYSIMLLNINGDQSLEETLPIALEYQVDGLIITSATLSSPLVEECTRFDTPVILFGRVNNGENVHSICTNNESGGRQIAEYLIQKGHRRISYIAGEAGSSTNRDRFRGFNERLMEDGITLYSQFEGDFTYPSGIEAAILLLSQTERPTAVFCASDYMAIAFMDVARNEFNLAIPDDISVAGFDDISMSSWPNYMLTTYHQHIEALVENTISILLQALKNPGMPIAHQYIQGKFVERSTVKEIS